MAVPPAVKRAHLETQRRLLAEERAASAMLVAVGAAALGGLSFASATALVEASDALAVAIGAAVTSVRSDARESARSTLANEIRVGAAESKQTALLAFGMAAPEPVLADAVAGRRVGADAAAIWLEAAREDPELASATLSRRLSSASRAQYGQAFASERETTLRRVDQSLGGRVGILKIWDALLDACPKCTKLDGKIRLVGFPFPGGAVPGLVHRHCRCIQGVIILGAAYVSEAA